MSPFKYGMAGLFALTMTCVLAVPAIAAIDTYLEIDGVPGESRDAGHSGWIEVQSWSFGASQGPQAGMMMGRPGMMGSQQPPPGPGAVTVTKTYDKSSPKLMEACAKGQHIPKATLSVRKAGGGTQEYLTYELENVMVSSYSLSSGGDRPMESISLNFTKITMMTAPEKPGMSGAPKSGYDVVPMKKM